ncbi:MAG: TlpA family protein disulfide reductase, partial [Chitinophagaceae bacterium]|nr:TlpA family protein disulfide reductase [Chitinophagaceae bacterium]
MKRLILILLACVTYAKAQSTSGPEPEVGKRCPDFTFDKIDFYWKKKVTLDDFRGKWLYLDFWDKNCSSCIASFPTINQEQKDLKDSIQFVMVTYEDKENEHRKMFANYHKGLHLEYPGAFAGTFESKNGKYVA